MRQINTTQNCVKKKKKKEKKSKRNCLLDNSISIKAHHLNRSRLHLSKEEDTILHKAFVKHVSDNFNWLSEKSARKKNLSKEYNSNLSCFAEKLNFIRRDIRNRIIKASLIKNLLEAKMTVLWTRFNVI